MSEKKQRPVAIGEAISRFLSGSGLEARVEQAQVVMQWAEIVGPRIAAVTKALSVTQDSVLLVAVNSHPWMTELSMMQRELLQAVNQVTPATPVREIRFQLTR